jgi:SAM-dependent methyltransferase
VDEALYGLFFAVEDHYWWSVGTRAIFREWLARALDGRAAWLLDLGCGTGALARELGAMGSVVGVDLSPAAIRFARRRGLERLAVGDAEALCLRSGSFDAVVAADVVEHADDDRVVSEAARVLRPGGVLLVHVPAFPVLWGEHDEVSHHRRRYRRETLRRLIERHELRVERLTYVVSTLFPLVFAIRVGKRWLGRRGSSKRPQPEVYRLPGWLNATLRRLLDVERLFLRWADLPFGVSLLCLARKPSTNGGL